MRLGILCPTTCVGLGYGRLAPRAGAFLGATGSPYYPPPQQWGHHHASPSHPLTGQVAPGLTWGPGRTLERAKPSGPRGYHCASPLLMRLPTSTEGPQTTTHHPPGKTRRPPSRTRQAAAWVSTRTSAWTVLHRYGNINPSSIDYACRPRLRSRLTQGGLAWPWNPWSFGARASHPSIATHACILTPTPSTPGSPRSFTQRRTLPYRPPPLPTTTNVAAEGNTRQARGFGGVLEPR